MSINYNFAIDICQNRTRIHKSFNQGPETILVSISAILVADFFFNPSGTSSNSLSHFVIGDRFVFFAQG